MLKKNGRRLCQADLHLLLINTQTDCFKPSSGACYAAWVSRVAIKAQF